MEWEMLSNACVQSKEMNSVVRLFFISLVSVDPGVLMVAGEVGPESGLLRRYDSLLFTVSEDL